MAAAVQIYLFRDSFSAARDSMVCVAELEAMERFMSVDELERAFSGFASYHAPAGCYVGVWGRRNGSRLRRFLRERGAALVLHRGKPENFERGTWATYAERARIRSLPPPAAGETPG